MKRFRWSSLANQTAAAGLAGRAGTNADRQGSTIVVVIALLLALTFLGIVGYTIGTQEHSNATYFADSAKHTGFGLSRDTLFDWALRQLILGTRQLEEKQSVLHGGHMSLMATMFGGDTVPYNGYGTNLAFNGGNIIVDQNYDGTDDALPGLLEINRSPAANGAIVNQSPASGYQSPDVGYTYWDINNPFLAYVNPAHVQDTSGVTVQVALPSFHRPQYLRPLAASGVTPDQWYNSPTTQRRVIRPHTEHMAVTERGVVTSIPRFISTLHPDTRAVPLAEQLQPFPFNANVGPAANNDADPTNDGVWDGVWTGLDNPSALASQGNVSYDADPDNDGFNEAIWMDLGFPMQIRENDDGTITNFVPMFAMTVYDADALLNLNAHGNLAGVRSFGNPFGALGPGPDLIYNSGDETLADLRFASQSNKGVMASEVNPGWGLTAPAPPPGDPTTDQHRLFFGHDPANTMELANMEWWFLAKGRADLDTGGNIQNLYQGRYGEIADLDTAITNTLDVFHYPNPGESFPGYPNPINFNTGNPTHLQTDDNFDPQFGGLYNGDGNYFPMSVEFPAWQQPLDLHGSGRFTEPRAPGDAQAGRRRLTQSSGQHKWPAYMNYQANPEVGLYANVNTRFLLPNYVPRFNVDDPEEMILEPDYALSELDAIFGPGENATLHLSQADQLALGLSGRVRDLAPSNFNGTDVAATEARRARFTTTSWDLKSFSDAIYSGTGGAGPPAASRPDEAIFADNYYARMRPELQVLIRDQKRKLSINHVLDQDAAGNLIFRPLTPHPTPGGPFGTLGSAPVVNPGTTVSAISSAQDQEWHARRDRQQLCRDIYTLLYLYGGGQDINYATTAGAYPDNLNESGADIDNDGIPDPTDGIPDEPLRMAQFAVNLVDRLDPDNVMTKFEFDVDLSNGWDLDDDPYGLPGNDSTTDVGAGGNRAVVFGVEEQQLALNEAQIVFAKRVYDNLAMAATNHDATEWDDTQNRDFTYIELENLSRGPVSFASEAWQIAVKPPLAYTTTPDPSDPMATPATVTGEERRLTFTNNHPGIGTWGANSIYLVGTAGDNQNLGTPPSPTGDPVASEFRVNRNHKHPEGDMANPNFDQEPHTSTMIPYQIISPRLAGDINLDLITGPQTMFRINQGLPNQIHDDVPVGGLAKGGDLLHLNVTSPDDISEQDDRDILVEIELRRRVNPLREAVTPRTTGNKSQHDAESADNPWVVVDRITVPIDVFYLQPNDDYDEIRGQLDQIRTRERRDPLVRENPEVSNPPLLFNQDVPAPQVGHWQNNSLGIPNIVGKPNHLPPTPSYDEYTQYQRHFNRDYGSAMELMAVPLYGPEFLTQELAETEVWMPTNFNNPAIIAAHKFMNPAGIDDGSGTGTAVPGSENRWYRLLEFVEVPDRSHRMADNGSAISHPGVIQINDNFTTGRWPFRYREPGRIQLNTLRHPEVLGGLLDDMEIMNWDLNPANNIHLPDRREGTNRDWWVQFIRARDGVDPVTAMTLPGLPSAEPFRPFNYSAEGASSINSTLLRELPADSGVTPASERRTLFGVGDQGQDVDPSVKYRLLEKVANNSTTRSNVFLVFMQVDFFEAAEIVDPGTGDRVVRVGAKLDDSPAYRGFFVIDRSRARYLIDAGDLPQPFTDPADSQNKVNYSFNPDWDFHQLIIHRQTIN